MKRLVIIMILDPTYDDSKSFQNDLPHILNSYIINN